MKNVSLKWTAHLSKTPDKTTFKNQLSSAEQVIERLKNILNEDLDNSIKESSSKTTFDTSNWSEYQAYLMGKQAYINQLKTLLPNYEE